MSFQWHVAYTHVQKEHLAIQNLQQQGFEAYAPVYQKVRRHARRKDIVLAPLFPRYVFIGWDSKKDQWSSVRSTRGISYLLENRACQPLIIPTSLIEDLKTQENESGAVTLAALTLFHKGEKVRILEGAFENYIGVYESMDDKQRVQILLDFMQREIKITLPIHALEAA